jgi:Tfp pilus assembly protein PilF
LLFASGNAIAQAASPPSAATLVRQGSDVLQGGDLDRAKSFFERALRLDPRNVEAHTYLGVIADRQGTLPEAERNFHAAVLDAPDSPLARNNYGAILMRLGRAEEAARHFERSLTLQPDQPAALLNLSTIRFNLGTPAALASARELLEKAEAIAPDLQAERALVLVDCRLNNPKRAAQDYLRYKKSIVAGKVETDAQGRRDLAKALLNAGLFPQAVDELRETSRQAPQDPQSVVLLAKALSGSGDRWAAGRTLESAVREGLDTGEIYAELARVYEATGHLENAIPAMRLAIERDPDKVDYRFGYGMLLTNSKAPQAAVMRLQEALEKFPRSAKLWFALAFAQLEDHKDANARSSLLKAAALDPNYAPAQVFLGVTEFQLGHYKEAQAYYARAIQLSPSSAVVHEMLAEAIQKQEIPDLKSAETELKRSIGIEPTFAPAHLTLGKLYLLDGRTNLAILSLEQAVRLDSRLTEAHYQLGRAYRKAKRNQEAQAQFDEFKQLTDRDKDDQIKERQELIRRLRDVLY